MIKTQIQIQITIKNDIVIFHHNLDGKLISDNIRSFLDIFLYQLENLNQKGYKKYIFDLKDIYLIDSSGFGALFLIVKNIYKHLGEIVFINPEKNIEELFEITRLDRQVNIFYNLDEAVSYFDKLQL